MTSDPMTHFQIADARHRARVRDATLRRAVSAAADRDWARRPTRALVRRRLP